MSETTYDVSDLRRKAYLIDCRSTQHFECRHLMEKAADRIEELERQLKTAGIRAVIEAYDRGGMERGKVFSVTQDLLDGYEPEFGGGLPEEWMNRVAAIWGEWNEEGEEDPEQVIAKADLYIDRIRAVIGMPPNEEETADE